MSYTTVAELRTALGVGTLYADATLQEVCDAADEVLKPFLWENSQWNVAHSKEGTVGTLYFDEVVSDIYYVGQDVTVSGNGASHNGTRVITEVGEYSISYTITAGDTEPRHPVIPYGKVAADDYVTYSTKAAVQEASLMICVSIWTSRQTNSGNGMNPDGSVSNMYAMSSQLISRVRGLLAPYLDPRSMVG